ncbi:hypothetical protein [Variovorax paradoxus]|uniref:hypothetical protein n=1 Tax=Variovorax paradoxus TaxID=34073 RepID=UPI002787158A|nr:hypothetical protein [Variovorax paradoxus]MDQ0590577.1 hypothetical protein [Variovorax paradoxus]
MTRTARALRRWLAAGLLGAACAAPAAATAGFGVMVHYLPDKQSIADAARFDVDAFAASLAQMRASHLILTLGQNNGQYIAPNAALEALCPRSAANRPPRDLPLEIGRALHSRGIALVLYLPFRAPQDDPELMQCLGDISEQEPPPAHFVAAWTAVIRDWSQHYGALARGWWFDGVYNTRGISPAGWDALCAAARSGAPDRWLAFNAGEGPARSSAKAAPCQNLMAGEFMQPPAQFGGPPSELKFHLLTPLGASWGQPTPPRFTAAQVRSWIAQANARGGLFTLDLPLDADFRFLPAHVALVRNATAPRP